MKKPETFEVRLASATMIAPMVRQLVFERVDGRPLDHDPGQWINLALPLPEGERRRAYSIASAPDGSNRFELAVTRVPCGSGSMFLHDLPEGSVLSAIGPHGLFTRASEDPSPSLFVGTGTGVTPLRAMMQAALATRSRAPLWLLFGARFEEDILYRAEMEAFTRAHPHVRYTITLSRPGESWTGKSGYVQTHVPALLRDLQAASAPALPHVYVCGLERMVKAVRELCRHELGVDRKHVHTERYD
ncbi:ferredoxin--NADP reductase [Polyangium jinanense]|uniref:FAD-dependent oxidoreductase n=1 Tax=Polyangium jinanense TaxID=2829994 RepID=A0A9X3X7K8_9BACT|nr:FAD-dependent oxidoreductase [Polyangium jinanense]MDC3955934.1 FAD-dependent oxidoreductase [Polyangium jinanense]MDC3985127.1 FAD-dependent oxidoreductase [Polyangium jinanense]